MLKNYRFIGRCVLFATMSPSLSMAERPLVLTGNQTLQATVQSLLASDIEVHAFSFSAETPAGKEVTQLMNTLLSAQLTIIEDDVVHPMLVERMQHQGASIFVVRPFGDRQSVPAMQDRLRAIHGVLVERFPEHEQELSQSLHGELQKLRERRAVKPPFASFFAVEQSKEALGKPTVMQRLHAEQGKSNERFLVKRAP